jgi:serine/threonine-protein kinase RsbT
MAVADEKSIRVESEADLVTARMKGRELASHLGFSSLDLTLIATAISELGRNILRYAQEGEIVLRLLHEYGKEGIVIVAQDRGPGIASIELAMQDGYSTSKSLGMGLPGTRRLMDEFQVVSEVGKGTTVTAKKWLRPSATRPLTGPR